MINSTSQVYYDFYGIQSADIGKQVAKNEPLNADERNDEVYQKNSPTTQYISKAVDKNEYALFTSTNQQKTLENIYTLFSQLLTNLPDKESYTADEVMSALPFAFDYDKKSLQITKTYTLQEFQDKIIKNKENDKNTKTMITFYESYSDIQKLKQSDVFENVDKNALSKNDIFNAFYSRNLTLTNIGSLIEGETTIRGKIEGLDRNLDDETLKDLRDFLDKNKLGNGGIFLWVHHSDELEYEQLLNSNLSIDEFKEKYLKFKEKVEMKQERWHKSSQDELQKALKSTQTNFAPTRSETMTNANEQDTSKIKGLFQATNRSEIYKKLDIQKTQNLLQDEQKLNVLRLLFNSNNKINVKA